MNGLSLPLNTVRRRSIFGGKASLRMSQLSTPVSFEDLKFGARGVIDIDLTAFCQEKHDANRDFPA
jgi:hypothetical protein